MARTGGGIAGSHGSSSRQIEAEHEQQITPLLAAPDNQAHGSFKEFPPIPVSHLDSRKIAPKSRKLF
jgi:hypothetical protein